MAVPAARPGLPSITKNPRVADDPSAAVVEAVAWFVADEPGWIERTLSRCVPRASGDCESCGAYRPVRWPCLQVWIARRAQEIVREHRQRRADSHVAARGCGLAGGIAWPKGR